MHHKIKVNDILLDTVQGVIDGYNSNPAGGHEKEDFREQLIQARLTGVLALDSYSLDWMVDACQYDIYKRIHILYSKNQLTQVYNGPSLSEIEALECAVIVRDLLTHELETV
ncbi:MAG: hypothetical protein EBV86_12225 [Marivivens sp.]|nr:hypothetical protein [Marivivens sp.]